MTQHQVTRYNNIDQLVDHRWTDGRQLWIVGCSISHGTAVAQDRRYGHLLSKKLDLPVSFLTVPGSSPEWAADQILRSDVRANDLVVWGLTFEARTPWWIRDKDMLVHVTLRGLKNKAYQNCGLDFDVPESSLLYMVSSDSRIYKSVTSVKQVANYCSKIKAKLLVIGLLPSDAVISQLLSTPEFAPLTKHKAPNEFLDYGLDNDHPGPKQHQYYADFCIEQMQNRGYI